jgi:ATP synthase, Delta/Epsilon chain, beta-sandwich domain
MPLHFELVTPEKLVRSEDVHMVVVPGAEGDFGVLEGHLCQRWRDAGNADGFGWLCRSE